MHQGIALGLNIDHVATLRQQRHTRYPEPVQAALLAEQSGVDNITLHLREDRRHIQERDVQLLAGLLSTRMNLEMAATDAMIDFACGVQPADCCLVPERREELTTEGGLDVVGQHDHLKPFIARLNDAGVRVSLFIAAEPRQIEMAAELRAPVIEIHSGAWCEAVADGHATKADAEWQRIATGAAQARAAGLEVHAGHGLDYATAERIAALPGIAELNIGYAMIGEALFVGIGETVRAMRAAIYRGRGKRGTAGRPNQAGGSLDRP